MTLEIRATCPKCGTRWVFNCLRTADDPVRTVDGGAYRVSLIPPAGPTCAGKCMTRLGLHDVTGLVVVG